ncbi:NAD-dependent epimerase/dehydratase family protein [Paramicrobacterium sp. CJ85]|uniref:NAD-dependent epimerase/dehydratase family protein n=1 Tax=Paramicrobacterium sp. CJ85 TaxID=3445355 RepID=UPI003F5F1881
MSERHLIIGAGPVGRHVAAELAREGRRVTVATRSGSDLAIPGVDAIALDASDPDALSRAAEGVDVLYNCANPRDYTAWETVWPPLASSLLTAAERSGAVYAITSSLYAYGPVDGPMHEQLPDAATDHKGRLRAGMWRDAKRLHDAGRIRAVEVRASDYVGPGIGQNGHISRQLPAASKGKTAWVFGRKDVPHTFTDVQDVARTIVAAAADSGAHGRVWLTPSNPAKTQEDALNDVFRAAGIAPVPVRSMPRALVAAASLVSPLMREINELAYQWRAPYLVDDSAARERFGIEPTPWDDVCRRTAGVTAVTL